MPRRKRKGIRARDRERVRSNRLAALTIAAVLLLGGAIIATWLIASEQHVKVDQVTFCPSNEPPAEVVVVLVDTSDPLSPVQATQMIQELKDIRDTIRRYGKLEVYDVGHTADDVREALFSVCNPGSPEEISGWRESPKRAHRQWQNGFIEPLNKMLARVVSTSSASRSPIIESIQSIAVTAFAKNELSGVRKRLVIVSDMLQHTRNYSHYRDGINFKVLQERPIYSAMTAHIQGVDVQILYVVRPRDQRRQGRTHIGFWEEYLGDQGARLVRAISLSG